MSTQDLVSGDSDSDSESDSIPSDSVTSNNFTICDSCQTKYHHDGSLWEYNYDCYNERLYQEPRYFYEQHPDCRITVPNHSYYIGCGYGHFDGEELLFVKNDRTIKQYLDERGFRPVADTDTDTNVSTSTPVNRVEVLKSRYLDVTVERRLDGTKVRIYPYFRCNGPCIGDSCQGYACKRDQATAATFTDLTELNSYFQCNLHLKSHICLDCIMLLEKLELLIIIDEELLR